MSLHLISQLFLLESYWDRDDWKSIKQHFIDLSLSFSSYSDHLVLKKQENEKESQVSYSCEGSFGSFSFEISFTVI